MDKIAIKPAISPTISPTLAPVTKIDPSDLNLDKIPTVDLFENSRKPWELIPGKQPIKFPEQEQQPKSNKLLLVAGVALLLLSLK